LKLALQQNPSVIKNDQGDLQFADWGCRAGQNNVVIRTDGTLAPCFPMYPATFDWGNIDEIRFDHSQLLRMKPMPAPLFFDTQS
jgi:hypothetical protein